MQRRTWHNCNPLDLHRLARTWFFDARRIELQKLAQELGVSRATVYRWAGSAEQLVGEVLASLVTETMDQLARETRNAGPRRILNVLNRVMQISHGFKPLRKFMEKDPQLALRVVASREGPVQARTIEKITELLKEDIEAGHITLPVEPAVMAFALTRMVESFLYADLITGAPADLEQASAILELMLRPPVAA
ncbi:MAG: AcrR family transcriptional regulator [Candidatus Azotimanducaceae bacterium]|jgi:AcrR family transcriptional regulator